MALLAGNLTAAENELTRRRAEFTEALRFEAAAKTQRDLRLLHMLQRRQRVLGWMTAEQHFLVLQPTADHRLVLAYVILAGRLALRERLCDASQVDALAERIREHVPRAVRATLHAADIDGTTIVAAWLRDRGERDGCIFRLADERERAPQVAEWRAACASLLVPPAALVDADAHAPQVSAAAAGASGSTQSA